MLMRVLLATLLTVTPLLAATKKAAPKPASPTAGAPESITHPVAMFLAHMSSSKKVTFSAAAEGQRFFFEEAGGVTIYAFDGKGYQKQKFLKGLTLAQAMKRSVTTR